MKTIFTKWLSCIVLLITPIFAFSQVTHSRVKLANIEKNDLDRISQLGIDLVCGAIYDHNDDGTLNLNLEISDIEVEQLQKKGFALKIVQEDMAKFYAQRNVADLPNARSLIREMEARNTQTNFRVEGENVTNIGQYKGLEEIDWAKPANFFPGGTMGSQGGFYTLKEVYDQLDLMRSLYPNLISVRTAASTTHTTRLGNTVFYVRISDNPDVDESEPESLINGNMHAREGMSVMNIIYHMWYLLENYSSDTAIQNLVDNHEMYFMPITNPDGYALNQFTNPNSGGGQRKNLRNMNISGITYDLANFEITSGGFTTSQGVDMNRNWGAGWGFNGNSGGSSGTTSSSIYRGPSPMSEPEARAIRELVLDHQFELCLNHHSFKDALLHAYAGQFQYLTGFEDQYYAYSQEMARYNRYVHGSSTEISYQNAGNTNDWMITPSADANNDNGSDYPTMSWTPENGNSTEGGPVSGFWPLPSNIIPIAKRAMRMNFMAHYLSGKYAKFHDLTEETLSGTSGTINFSVERLGRTDSDYTVTITPKSGGISFATTSQVISNPGMLSFTDIQFNYTLPSGTAANTYIGYDVKLENDDYTLYEATISKIFQPTVIIADNMTASSNWTTNGTGGWTYTNDGYNGTTGLALTLSGGEYPNGLDNEVQFIPIVDLSTTDKATLSFKAKWDVERNFDYMQLQASVDGVTWTPLVGKYTRPGSNELSASNTSGNKSNADKQNQPDGEPIWDGFTREKWMFEEINLDNYTGGTNQAGTSTLSLKFVFESDSNNPGDAYDQTATGAAFRGFVIDDFQVIAQDANILPVELISFEAKVIDNDQVELDWSTASEENNAGFDIQRSSDGITWMNLAFVPGQGTTSTLSNYTYTDHSPKPGVNFYRLKQVDEIGTFEFSDVQKIEITVNDITVYVDQGRTAVIGLPSKISFIYSIVNTVGEIIQVGEAEDAIGSIDVDLANLSNGVYYINIIEKDGNYQKAFPIRKMK